jgi:hypothetical protein
LIQVRNKLIAGLTSSYALEINQDEERLEHSVAKSSPRFWGRPKDTAGQVGGTPLSIQRNGQAFLFFLIE